MVTRRPACLVLPADTVCKAGFSGPDSEPPRAEVLSRGRWPRPSERNRRSHGCLRGGGTTAGTDKGQAKGRSRETRQRQVHGGFERLHPTCPWELAGRCPGTGLFPLRLCSARPGAPASRKCGLGWCWESPTPTEPLTKTGRLKGSACFWKSLSDHQPITELRRDLRVP